MNRRSEELRGLGGGGGRHFIVFPETPFTAKAAMEAADCCKSLRIPFKEAGCYKLFTSNHCTY